MQFEIKFLKMIINKLKKSFKYILQNQKEENKKSIWKRIEATLSRIINI